MQLSSSFLLPVILLFALAFPVLAQEEGKAALADSLVEYGPVVISFESEEKALTFDVLSSAMVEEVTWERANQRLASASGKAAPASVFSSSPAFPPRWDELEKFLVVRTPKAAFTLEINGRRTRLDAAGVDVKIHLGPLLAEEGDSLRLRVWGDKVAGEASELASVFLIMAAPGFHVVETQVRTLMRYPNYYRSLTWFYLFRLRNYSSQTFNTSDYSAEEKVMSLIKGQLKEYYVHDRTGSIGQSIPKGKTHSFFYTDHPEVIAGKWTSETPYLHLVTNTISSIKYKFSQVLAERVGVRTTKVQDRQLQVNGVPVRFKPVSYTLPALSEAAPSADQLETFIRELKQHHVNTIFVSGIPASLELYHLADKYGLYIIQHLAPEVGKEPGLQLRLPLSLVRKLRNRPSVIAWSADKAHLALLTESLTHPDPDRPLIEVTNADAITNLPFAAIDFSKLSAEERADLKKANQPFRMELTNDRGMSISNGYDFAAAPGKAAVGAAGGRAGRGQGGGDGHQPGAAPDPALEPAAQPCAKRSWQEPEGKGSAGGGPALGQQRAGACPGTL
ncbi:glycosyl hydrolase family 2 [Pontibacter mucosus]|uniref:beta-galactosidase n=1 Tax=Pontibacter mucosus TaxID=1649266 RepID=A0A2T5YDX2_9BACT|nr:glycoside hydrolase family 2 TIM barrel-domain containing protein [Pontibacter mucosus]PTX14730.1 glycosyl hydrolase family 2 [Pontibacter mucosus]